MQDNLAWKNKYLCPFLSFSMLPSLLQRIHTDISVVPRLHYTGTKGRPGRVFRSGMKPPINSFGNAGNLVLTTGLKTKINHRKG